MSYDGLQKIKVKGIDLAYSRPGASLAGYNKLIIDPVTERILGVGIVGHGAGELIGEGTVAIEMGATVHDLGAIVHPHPTLSETLMEGAEVFFGHSTHVFTKKREH